MEIGIVTFYYAHNYGAVLQAYALKTYLEQQGHDVSMYPHINDNVALMYPKVLKPIIPKRFFINPQKWKYIFNELKKVSYSKSEWQDRYLRFKNFIDKYLLNDSSDEMLQKDYFDLLVFGSDQVWEKNIIGNDLTYVGKIETSAEKVSYAASCFSSNSTFTDEMICELKKFSKLSARENDIAIRLGKLTNKEVVTVCDPVFLLDADHYKNIMSNELKENKYTLFYFVAEDEELTKLCSYYRNVEKKRVIEIHYSKFRKESVDYKIDYGPEEFLYLLANADEVYTNSFHGTAFSIIFHKQCYVKSKNLRLMNILHILEIENRVIDSCEEFINLKGRQENIIDYDHVDLLKKKYIFTSKNYIDDILKRME